MLQKSEEKSMKKKRKGSTLLALIAKIVIEMEKDEHDTCF